LAVLPRPPACDRSRGQGSTSSTTRVWTTRSTTRVWTTRHSVRPCSNASKPTHRSLPRASSGWTKALWAIYDAKYRDASDFAAKSACESLFRPRKRGRHLPDASWAGTSRVKRRRFAAHVPRLTLPDERLCCKMCELPACACACALLSWLRPPITPKGAIGFDGDDEFVAAYRGAQAHVKTRASYDCERQRDRARCLIRH
jgi:hypothetical protein